MHGFPFNRYAVRFSVDSGLCQSVIKCLLYERDKKLQHVLKQNNLLKYLFGPFPIVEINLTAGGGHRKNI